MRRPSALRLAFSALALLGNFSISGTALAHGYAHHELAHYSHLRDSAPSASDIAGTPSVIGNLNGLTHDRSGGDHGHPEITARGTERPVSASFTAISASTRLPATVAQRGTAPAWHICVTSRWRSAPPPHLRAPPVRLI